VLTDVALPEYLERNIQSLKNHPDGSVVDMEAIFHELTTQLMGQMAYDVSTSFGVVKLDSNSADGHA
jgi:hypothetical protein